MSIKITHEDFVKRIHKLSPELEIRGTYIAAKKRIEVRCTICGNVWFPFCDSLSHGHSCKKCKNQQMGKVFKTPQDEIVLKVKNLVGDNIILVSEYKNNRTPLTFHCNICGKDFQKTIVRFCDSPKCPICNHTKCVKGINDLWTIRPDIAELLLNPNEGYTHTDVGSELLDWKCTCGTIIPKKPIFRVLRYGICCPCCNDNLSYPNKFMYNLLNQLHVDFMPEKIFDWSHKKKYDFYIPSKNYIVEMHGMQHYIDVPNFNSEKTKVHSNDVFKKQIALNNGIALYDEIDARYSNCNHIKDSILSSKFNGIFDLSKVDWQECDKSARKSILYDICKAWSDGKKIIDIASEFKIHTSTVSSYLVVGEKLNLCSYDPIESRKSCCKSVVCETTGEIFSTMEEANLKYNAPKISSCCSGKTNYSGRLPTGERLFWRYYIEGEIVVPRQFDVYKNKSSVPVVCTNTNEVFESAKEAANTYKTWSSSILDCCKGVVPHSGKLESGEKLVWKYYYESDKNNNSKVIKKGHPVICITTGEIYSHIKIASEKTGANVIMIRRCCQGKSEFAGRLPDGTKLLWDFYIEGFDYSKGTINEKPISKKISPVYCINTMETFNSMTAASKTYNINHTLISGCCSGKLSFAGYLPNGEKLQWRYA